MKLFLSLVMDCTPYFYHLKAPTAFRVVFSYANTEWGVQKQSNLDKNNSFLENHLFCAAIIFFICLNGLIIYYFLDDDLF